LFEEAWRSLHIDRQISLLVSLTKRQPFRDTSGVPLLVDPQQFALVAFGIGRHASFPGSYATHPGNAEQPLLSFSCRHPLVSPRMVRHGYCSCLKAALPTCPSRRAGPRGAPGRAPCEP
jgi:hypothetical protein